MIATTTAAVLLPVAADKIADRVGASQEQVDKAPLAPEVVHEIVGAHTERISACSVESIQLGSEKQRISVNGALYNSVTIDLGLSYNPAASEKLEAFEDDTSNLLQVDTELVVNYTPADPADGDRTEQKLSQITPDKNGTPVYKQPTLDEQLSGSPSEVSTSIQVPLATEGDRLTLGIATHAASARYNEEQSAYQPCGWAEFKQGNWEIHLPPTAEERAQLERDAMRLQELFSQASIVDVNSTDERLGQTPWIGNSQERRKLVLQLGIEQTPEQAVLLDRYSEHKNPWLSVESVINAGVRRPEMPEILAPIETGSVQLAPGEVAFTDDLRAAPDHPVTITLVPRDAPENTKMELAVVTCVTSPLIREGVPESTLPIGELVYRDDYWRLPE